MRWGPQRVETRVLRYQPAATPFRASFDNVDVVANLQSEVTGVRRVEAIDAHGVYDVGKRLPWHDVLAGRGVVVVLVAIASAVMGGRSDGRRCCLICAYRYALN